MSHSESESEKALRVIEYWKKAHDANQNKNKDSIYYLSSLEFTRNDELPYERAVEGISLTLSEAWNKFNDAAVPEKQKLGYLRLTKECNESVINLTANGASVLAIQDITKRAERLGLGIDNLQQHAQIKKEDPPKL